MAPSRSTSPRWRTTPGKLNTSRRPISALQHAGRPEGGAHAGDEPLMKPRTLCVRVPVCTRSRRRERSRRMAAHRMERLPHLRSEQPHVLRHRRATLQHACGAISQGTRTDIQPPPYFLSHYSALGRIGSISDNGADRRGNDDDRSQWHIRNSLWTDVGETWSDGVLDELMLKACARARSDNGQQPPGDGSGTKLYSHCAQHRDKGLQPHAQLHRRRCAEPESGRRPAHVPPRQRGASGSELRDHRARSRQRATHELSQTAEGQARRQSRNATSETVTLFQTVRRSPDPR